jgi:hypothetical protein
MGRGGRYWNEFFEGGGEGVALLIDSEDECAGDECRRGYG